MAAGVGRDDGIFPNKLVTSGIDPIFVATRTSMQQQERFSGAVSLVIHLQIVKLYGFSCHWVDYRPIESS